VRSGKRSGVNAADDSESVSDLEIKSAKRGRFSKTSGDPSSETGTDSKTSKKVVDNEKDTEVHPKKPTSKKKTRTSKIVNDKESVSDEEVINNHASVKLKCADSGFKKGWTLEKIIGAMQRDGNLQFLVKWKGREDNSLVNSSEANVKCPQDVIKFYESNLQWMD